MSLKDPNRVDRHHPKRIAIVLSNPATSTTTNWPVGFWWSELTHPWMMFRDVGYEIRLFSPDGGACEADALRDPRDPSGYSADDLISMGFISTTALAALPHSTRPVSEIAINVFDAIVVAGGQAPMFTFEHATALQEKFAEFFEGGKIAAALCHGTALPRYTKLSKGAPLVTGRRVTALPTSRRTSLTTRCGTCKHSRATRT